MKHILRYNIIIITMALSIVIADSCKNEQFEWDSSEKSGWTSSFEKVEIHSSADSTLQPAYFRKAQSDEPKPLIVSLHTWSGGYDQKDPMTADIEAKDLNYIHPHFRGFNNRPEAMVSRLVISDIDDAIEYAIENGNVDPDEIHIVGVSGGGMATIAAYMELSRPIKSFNAWVPISDIHAWYWESLGRRFNYASHIMAAIGHDGKIDTEEARRRSPLFKPFPKEARKNAILRIYAGIHDGHIGCVPISHSINFYNRIVGELKYGTDSLTEIYRFAEQDSELVSKNLLMSLLEKRLCPENLDSDESLLGRHVHLSRCSGNISLVIFEGEHEQIPGALELIVQEVLPHSPQH